MGHVAVALAAIVVWLLVIRRFEPWPGAAWLTGGIMWGACILSVWLGVARRRPHVATAGVAGAFIVAGVPAVGLLLQIPDDPAAGGRLVMVTMTVVLLVTLGWWRWKPRRLEAFAPLQPGLAAVSVLVLGFYAAIAGAFAVPDPTPSGFDRALGDLGFEVVDRLDYLATGRCASCSSSWRTQLLVEVDACADGRAACVAETLATAEWVASADVDEVVRLSVRGNGHRCDGYAVPALSRSDLAAEGVTWVFWESPPFRFGQFEELPDELPASGRWVLDIGCT